MSAQIIDIATRRAPLRLVQPTLAQRLQMSLTPAPSDWPGKRVIVNASGMTGVVNFWDPDSRSLVVEYDNSELGLHDASDLTRIGSQPQGDGMPGDCT